MIVYVYTILNKCTHNVLRCVSMKSADKQQNRSVIKSQLC